MLSGSELKPGHSSPGMAEFRRPDGDRALPRLMELSPVGRGPCNGLKREKGVGKSRDGPSQGLVEKEEGRAVARGLWEKQEFFF